MLTAVIFFLFISLAVVLSLVTTTVSSSKVARDFLSSKKSYFLAEAGAEDMVYRIATGKNYSSSETISLDGATTTVTVASVGSDKEVTSSGDANQNIRKVKTRLSNSSQQSFHYGVQVGEGGITMDNGSKVNGNVFSNGSISGGTVTGDAIVAGAANQISNATIGNTGHASNFINTIIHGSQCPNPYCIIENPSPQNLPISEDTIQSWRSAATAGATCGPPLCDQSGNLTITNGGSQIVGPIKIPGNLIVNNNARLIVKGTIWVLGNINFSNNCSIQLDSSYGNSSGIVATDGIINVSNNCTFAGSGAQGSYIMLLSAKNAPTSQVIDISNNSFGVIFYAGNARIHFNNNSGSKEATAYGIDLDANATITYESGLANVNFSSGPGGSFSVNLWQEIK